MADNIFRTEYVKLVFGIPDWYFMTKKEEDKLSAYMRMTNTHQDARMYRFLDCTTICDERLCYSGVPLDLDGCHEEDLKREVFFHIFPLCSCLNL